MTQYTCHDIFQEDCPECKYRPRYDLMTQEDYDLYMNALSGRLIPQHRGKNRRGDFSPEDEKKVQEWRETATRHFMYHKLNKQL